MQIKQLNLLFDINFNESCQILLESISPGWHLQKNILKTKLIEQVHPAAQDR